MTTGSTNERKDISKKKALPRGRKRRLMPKDINAPKGPSSGYMLFMNDHRESVKKAHTKAAFSEINRLVAQKWAQLDMNEKQKYLEAAEVDKERYQMEIKEYKKTDAYKNFIREQRAMNNSSKKSKESIPHSEKINANSDNCLNANNALEIPIFTEEFLNHNKIREGELRQLRKSNIEYEEQNAILQKHIENMRTAVEKLEAESRQQQANNATLKQHLSTLRKNLAQAFSSVNIPGTREVATEETIDSYIAKLHSTLTSHPQQYNRVAQNVRQIINNLPS